MKAVLLRFALPVFLLSGLFSCKPADRSPQSTVDKSAFTTDCVEHPDWINQSNIYEVNLRQYTQEGTFKAFEKSLARLREMGVDILWFMPITPISKLDRKGTLGSYYAVANYEAVNPEFGTMDDFKKLVKQAHKMGFKVITDWVANHTGADNYWLTRHPDFYNRDSTGKAAIPFDWTDTRDLNYWNPELRDSMIACMKFWVLQTGIDGFRCDAAAEVPRFFWQDCIEQLRAVREDLFMLAEGDAAWLQDAGFDCTYSWDVFNVMKEIAAGRRNALSIDTVLMAEDNTFPPDAVRMYFTSNHDENSWNKSDYGTFPGSVHAPFAVLTQTMRNGLPLIYSGQEEPVLRPLAFFEKDPIVFSQYKRAPFYKKLLALRAQNPALGTDASFERVDLGHPGALYAYVREKDKHKVAVILNLSPQGQMVTIGDSLLEGYPLNVFTGKKEMLKTGATFPIKPWGYFVYDYDSK